MLTRILALLLLLALLVGCAGSLRPDLEQLYAMTGASAARPPPVVLIHGVFGAVERKTQLSPLP